MSPTPRAALVASALAAALLAICAADGRAAVCGNGTCEAPETAASCDADCHYACGDGLCGCGETHVNCEVDCPDATCGSGFCEAPETYTTCSDDCYYDCGDGVCGPEENFGNCEVDCPTSTCNDGTCDPWEDPTSCPADCIDNCGDGFCSNSAELGFEDYKTCPADCPSPTCGDGFCTNGEDYETCSVDCPSPACGDAVCGAGEDCYSCETDCGACTPLCGDGLAQGSEECDDGNTTSGDGCSDVCVVEFCGDGLTQAGIGEQCDDGNDVPDDGCTALCQTETCGDVFAQPGIGEACDSDSELCTTATGYPGTTACKTDCTGYEATCTTRLSCGDGICTFPPESADPAASGYCPQDCAPPPSACIPFDGQTYCQSACGDGIVSGLEGCDDGNTDSLDGCSAECQPDSVPALPLVDLGAVNGGDFDDDGQLDGGDIQSALDTACGTGCILELPAAEYLDVEVLVPASITDGLVIRGQGIGATVLKAPVPQVEAMFSVEYADAFTVFQKMTLDGLKQVQPTFDYSHSTKAIAAGHGTAPDVGPGRVEHVELKNHVRFGLNVKNAQNWILDHSVAHDIGCGDDLPCDLIDLPYLDQSVYPQLKSTGWGVIYQNQGASGATAHHNVMWNVAKHGIETYGVLNDYHFYNNFIFAARGGIVTNSSGGLRGLVDHNYVERTQNAAIYTRTGETTVQNNVLFENYGRGINVVSRDRDLLVSDNYMEHDCRRFGSQSFSVSREGSTGDGAVVRGNEIHIADNCTNPVFIRRSNTLIENNLFAGGRPDQWVMILLNMCDAEIRNSTVEGIPSAIGIAVSKGVANLEATANVAAIDVTQPYTIHGTIDPVRDNIHISLNDDYDEAQAGDLSGDHLNPTQFALTSGENWITASQQGDAFGRDVDYVTFTVPTGMMISAITVESYSGAAGSPAFLGLQSGSVFTVDAETAQPSDLLGGTSYDASDVGQDILAAVGALPGATGFTPPLFAGSYTLWLDQTGDPSTVTLSIVLVAQPTGPEIDVRGQGQAIADGDTTPEAGDGTLFLATDAGTPRTFVIRNLGATALDVTSVTTSGPNASDFAVSGFAPGPVATSGGAASFALTFLPAAPGSSTATVEIANDDPDEAPYTFAVSGTAGATLTPIPSLPSRVGLLVMVAAVLMLGLLASRRPADEGRRSSSR